MDELKLDDLSGKKILIVEDDLRNLELLVSFFEDTNVEILVADDGQKAVSICQTNHDIDLILMDIMLPNMNGMEATELIKKINHRIPVIAQTAYSMINDSDKCKCFGCDDFIRKPIDLEELLIKVKRYLFN